MLISAETVTFLRITCRFFNSKIVKSLFFVEINDFLQLFSIVLWAIVAQSAVRFKISIFCYYLTRKNSICSVCVTDVCECDFVGYCVTLSRSRSFAIIWVTPATARRFGVYFGRTRCGAVKWVILLFGGCCKKTNFLVRFSFSLDWYAAAAGALGGKYCVDHLI